MALWIIAGTLNPHLPKCLITASEIDQWVDWKGTAKHRSEAIRRLVELGLRAKK
jgi:hypothetical protein